MSQNWAQSQIKMIQKVPKNQQIIPNNQPKIPATTRYTQLQKNTILSEYFVLGKNNLIENNTSAEQDSSDNESNISFQESLNFFQQKIMAQQLKNYLQLKGAIGEQENLSSEQFFKSTESFKQIEERVIQEIRRLYGTIEVQKMKLTLKFIKRNEDLTKIYVEVIKSIPSNIQMTIFVLLKHSVIVYLEGRQTIRKQQNEISDISIRKYLTKNIQRISQQLMKDEKLQLMYDSKVDKMLTKRFQSFLNRWMEGFFLVKEGYPCTSMIQVQKKPHPRTIEQQKIEKRKKLKKF